MSVVPANAQSTSEPNDSANEKHMAQQSTETTFDVPQGQLQLRRYPRREGERLRAWDAGDTYLLQHLHEVEESAGNGATWIVNDAFGALTVAVAASTRPLYM